MRPTTPQHREILTLGNVTKDIGLGLFDSLARFKKWRKTACEMVGNVKMEMKTGVRVWTGFHWVQIPVAGYYEHDINFRIPYKTRNFLAG
jgi:hypothetical protein